MVAFLSHSLYPSSHSSLGCIATEVVNYFTYTPSDPNSNVLVIELTALPSTTLFVNPGFATYAQGTYNCVADELGYCYIILTCNGDCQSLRTIYFHVFGGPGSHSVRVTEESVVSRLAQLDDGPQSVSLSSGSQIYSFKLPVPAFGTNFSNPSSVPPPPLLLPLPFSFIPTYPLSSLPGDQRDLWCPWSLRRRLDHAWRLFFPFLRCCLSHFH